MYCKYCGKQIDDDSNFCKYCGKSLNDAVNLLSPLIGHFKQRTVFVALLVIWILLAIVISSDCSSSDIYDYLLPFTASFGSLLVTLILFGLIYWSYEKFCKHHINLIDKSDSVKVKIAKYLFLAYTYCVPFLCIYNATCIPMGIATYYIILAYIWLIPTLVICSIYHMYKLKKNH